MMMNLRLIAAYVVQTIQAGKSLDDSLTAHLNTCNHPADRAFIKAICYGVCRYYYRLNFILNRLLEKPLPAKAGDIQALLLVGLYQLLDMRVPPHAAVTETVAAAEGFKKPWAKGLINAILRRYLREREIIENKITSDLEACYLHPLWWIQAVQAAWPQEWQSILEASNAHPPLALRINLLCQSREAYLKQWSPNSLKVIPYTAAGVIILSPVAVEQIPGFKTGEVSVQDGAAQLAAELLELKPGLRVLDACAAPGGKLLHILELEPHLSECVAVEKNPDRAQLIEENLTRAPSHLRERVEVKIKNLNEVAHWWDRQPFDRILLDAPCSASGVARRHPDIKLLRRPSDLVTLAKAQYQMLESVWPLLTTGGLVVYATCSIFPAENSEVVRLFLANHRDASEEKIDAAWGIACAVGRQILPGMHEMDGFYYAKLRKTR